VKHPNNYDCADVNARVTKVFCQLSHLVSKILTNGSTSVQTFLSNIRQGQNDKTASLLVTGLRLL
jgi:hypothetical protein